MTAAVDHLAVALRLAGAGAAVFPIDPTTKKPPDGFLWRARSTAEESSILALWLAHPGAGVAIDLAKTGLVAIDCDRHAEKDDGVAAFRKLSANHAPIGPEVPIVETAGGGEHLIFRNLQDEPLTNARGALPAGIDVRGAGGYIVAAGTVRPDGSSWKHADGTADLVSALEFDAVPEIPGWIVDIIRTKKPDRDTSSNQSSGSAHSDDRVRAYVDAAVANECEAVARAPSGARNETLNKAAFALGTLVGAGALDAGMAADVLFAAAIAASLVKDDGPRACRATIRSGLEAGRRSPRDLSDIRKESVFFRDPPVSDETPSGDDPQSDPLAGFLFDGDAAIEPPPALIKRLVPYDGIAFIGGQSGAGKTFVACDLAASLASGQPFFGHKVCERVGVVIFAAEGSSTIPARIHVARENKAPGELLPISWLGAVPNLADPAEVQRVIPRLVAVDAKMRAAYGVRLGAIICDTLAASFNLDDEDDNSEAAKAIRRMKELGSAVGAVVLPVHHYGKGAETGLRGASGWRAGCDVVLSVLADRNQITGKVANRSLALAKSRVGEEGSIAPFALRFVQLGVDKDGEEFGACVVDIVTDAQPSAASRMTNVCKAYIDAFHRIVLDQGAKLRPFGMTGPEVRAVDREAIRAEFYAAWPADSTDAKKKAFRRAEQEAIERNLMVTREISGRQMVWADRVEEGPLRAAA